MSLKSWYKQLDGDSTCKNNLKKKNDTFFFEAMFSRNMNLKIRQVPVC